MTIFKLKALKTSALITASFILSALTHADTVVLLNGDLITGTITAMSEEDTTLESTVSASPLHIKSSRIKQIKFTNDQNNIKHHAEVLTLSNGDIIPCHVISMDEQAIKISTWYAGEFTIARENIQSLRFGLSDERNIYTGGDELSNWDTNKGVWKHRKGTYSSRKSGVLARKLNMPENIRIRFTLAWQDLPNFAFRFCAESNSATRKQDTYELVFNTSGMQIRRYQDTQHSAPLANIDIKPYKLDAKKIHIDLRLNRTKGTLTLYLDQKNIGTWHDVFEAAEGNHIIFNNRSNNNHSCNISAIQVSDWNDGAPSRHFTRIGPTKIDVIIDNEGDKISGEISRILSSSDKERTIEFNSNHSAKPFMIPDRRVSILYFAEPENAIEFPQPVFTATLKGYGRIQLGKLKLENNKIITHHPILGLFTLDHTIISNIRQSKNSAKK